MNTHVVKNSNENMGYPMYFKTQQTKDGLIINMCHNKPIEVGDRIRLYPDPKMPHYKVMEVLEQREPSPKTSANPDNVNHHPKGVQFYQVNTFLS